MHLFCTHFQTSSYLLHPHLCRIPIKRFCKRLSSQPLSSSNVDKLKTSMGFQLATTDNLEFFALCQIITTFAPESIKSSHLRMDSPTEFWKPRWSVRCGSNNYKLQKHSKLCNSTFISSSSLCVSQTCRFPS